MKLCNDVITVLHAQIDPDVGGDVWAPTVIRGASWYATDASTVDASKGGLVAANKVIVRIPAEAAPDGFIMSNGDIIVKGEATGNNWTPTALKRAFSDCATILGITDNRRAPNAPHWRVTLT